MRSEEPRSVRLSEYRPPDYLIDQVDLDVVLDGDKTLVTSVLEIRPNPEGRSNVPLVLDGDEITLAGPPLLDNDELTPEAYVETPQALRIHMPPKRAFSLKITTKLDPAKNTKLMGLYRSGAAYCTQCEAEGFRRITYFIDRPDVLSTYRVRIEAGRKEAPVLLSNGNPVEAGLLPNGRHYAVWDDPWPKPCYLFALVGGDLGVVRDSFVTVSGRHVGLAIYVEHGKEDRASYAMDALKRSMKWDEDVFGREYDLQVFNIVAVSDFNMGAMENKGLNVFNDKYVLASGDTATDGDYAGIEAVIAHEYFHNWTGNRITCRDWFQLCLKEGLTVFRDQEFTADMRSRPVERISDVRGLRAIQFVEDAGPFAHPVRPDTYREINNFYTATVYEKGAEVIRMLQALIGRDAFRLGMEFYFSRHDGRAATIEEFIACFADASATDLSQFLLWYSQAGTPEVAATSSWDEDTGTYTLNLLQTVPKTPGQDIKKPMVIPLAFGLLGMDGEDLPIGGDNAESGLIVLNKAEHSFAFRGLNSRPVLSINRTFSAPVKLTTDLTENDLFFLARYDSDPFNRWQALQTAALRVLIRSVHAVRGGNRPLNDPRLAEAFASAIADPEIDPALLAQLLALPSETDIAREIGNDVDPDAIYAARIGLKRALARFVRGALADLYRGLVNDGPYSPDARAAGRRALRATALDLICAEQDDASAMLAFAHYSAANNMTDRMSGLAVLSGIDRPERDQAFADFYKRHKGDALVLDKWLSLQAVIPEAGTLDRVRRLMKHEAFSMANPNRVRALIGAFAASNPTQFNRADGAGFDFLADIVIDLDPKNPQVAARLLGAFRSWRALEPGRRGRAEFALKRIAATDKLSPDVSDLVIRALA
ncbi:aminopeptidase N [Terrihabitans soli]|uniref:Aminopeptidase N n=1 Tax=Terrihabitans soli TaxID=708113 RepID=A0A6S6QJ60_9HYPH|nr:aminopeptidase N [Terrihabitans soli]BCJ90304.1 aminopeptidase N [Terrihabitans soli]